MPPAFQAKQRLAEEADAEDNCSQIDTTDESRRHVSVAAMLQDEKLARPAEQSQIYRPRGGLEHKQKRNPYTGRFFLLHRRGERRLDYPVQTRPDASCNCREHDKQQHEKAPEPDAAS